MLNSSKITHNGKLLSDILSDHTKWLKVTGGQRANLSSANLWGADLSSANLRGADLRGADLSSANLRGADLRGATGNMGEVKSLHVEQWAITYTADVMQIGCQRHSIEMWRKADPRWIATMDSMATDWWAKFGAFILNLIDISPATPTGHEGK